jgi:MFS family permease
MILSTPLTPYVGIITLGIHTTVVPAALYPCIPLLISAQFEGIGYAAMSSLINAALAGVSPLVGWILESFGFFWLCFCLAAVTLLAAVLSIVWNIVDFKSAQPILNEPEPPQEELSRLLDTERGDESMKQITTLSSASAVTTDCDTIHLDS